MKSLKKRKLKKIVIELEIKITNIKELLSLEKKAQKLESQINNFDLKTQSLS